MLNKIIENTLAGITIFTALDAAKAEPGTWGYFANDVEHLKKAVENNKVNLYSQYSCLESVLPENEPKRFEAFDGYNRILYALFCPTDKSCNDDRY